MKFRQARLHARRWNVQSGQQSIGNRGGRRGLGRGLSTSVLERATIRLAVPDPATPLNPSPLRALDVDLWIAERPQRFYGLEVGTKMSAIRLADGSLLLHSPVALDARLRAELDAIGPVRFAVAPNRVHHLYAGRVAETYPDARLWVGPGVERKRPDLVYVDVLGDEAPAEWRGQVDQVFFRGRPYENEVVFFHRRSRTLIICDLAFNIGPEAALPTRWLMRLIGSYGRFGPSTLDPWLIRDRAAARASLERILAWDFDRVVVAHGDVLEHGGHHALRRGYRWLLAA